MLNGSCGKGATCFVRFFISRDLDSRKESEIVGVSKVYKWSKIENSLRDDHGSKQRRVPTTQRGESERAEMEERRCSTQVIGTESISCWSENVAATMCCYYRDFLQSESSIIVLVHPRQKRIPSQGNMDCDPDLAGVGCVCGASLCTGPLHYAIYAHCGTGE